MGAEPGPDWRATLQRAWLSRGGWARLLWPVSVLFGWALAWRRWRLRTGRLHSTRLPVPVVVVGNVVVGGAGKTPSVIGLVRHLQRQGWRPGVVSRGYGRTTARHADVLAVTACSNAQDVGDEPLLIAQATGVPVTVARDRVRAGQWLLKQHPTVDIVVSDDGMQHWALVRDLTVVVFDQRGTGNGWLLPAGLLREPWPARPIGDETLLVLQQTTPGVAPPALGDRWPVYTAQRHLASAARNALGHTRPWRPDSRVPLEPTPPICALAGIAQPERFFAPLRAAGLVLGHALPLADHATGSDLITALQTAPDSTWYCTEKDAVKLFGLLRGTPLAERVWAIPLEQAAEPAFYSAVDRVLNGLSSGHGPQTP